MHNNCIHLKHCLHFQTPGKLHPCYLGYNKQFNKMTISDKSGEYPRKLLSQKDFYWDRIATLIVMGILGLTVLNVVAEIFYQTSSIILCMQVTRPPEEF